MRGCSRAATLPPRARRLRRLARAELALSHAVGLAQAHHARARARHRRAPAATVSWQAPGGMRGAHETEQEELSTRLRDAADAVPDDLSVTTRLLDGDPAASSCARRTTVIRRDRDGLPRARADQCRGARIGLQPRDARRRSPRDRRPPARWQRRSRPGGMTSFTVLDAPWQPRSAPARARASSPASDGSRRALRGVRAGRPARRSRRRARRRSGVLSVLTRTVLASRATLCVWRRGSARCSTRASGRWCSAATAASCSGRCWRCGGEGGMGSCTSTAISTSAIRAGRVGSAPSRARISRA